MQNKDDWNKFIKRLLARKRSDRKYSVPRDYIESLADRIFTTNPTKEILINTLVDFYEVSFGHGYQRKDSDIRFFKEKRDKQIKVAWNKERDGIDDDIHKKNK